MCNSLHRSAFCLSLSSSIVSLSDFSSKVEQNVFFCFDFNIELFLYGLCLISKLAFHMKNLWTLDIGL